MASCQQKKDWLTAAETAWHQLNMGAAVVRTRYGDKEVELSSGNMGNLARYINQLRTEISACDGTYDSGVRRVVKVVPV